MLYKVKDLFVFSGLMIQDSENKSNYTRYQAQFGTTEFIAHAISRGAHTENRNYFDYITILQNTQFHEKTLRLKSVCWFSIATHIDKVKINIKEPIYDVYIYHASDDGIRGLEGTTMDIEVTFGDNTQKFPQNFLTKDLINQLNSKK